MNKKLWCVNKTVASTVVIGGQIWCSWNGMNLQCLCTQSVITVHYTADQWSFVCRCCWKN